MMPSSASLSLKVVATETLSNTASTATPASIFCSSRGMPSFSYVASSSGSTSSRLSSCGFCFGGRVVADPLVVDLGIVDHGPALAGLAPRRVLHALPVVVRLEAPLQQPLRFFLLAGDEGDDLLVQAGRGRVGLDVGDEAVLVLAVREFLEDLGVRLRCGAGIDSLMAILWLGRGADNPRGAA